MKILYHHGGPSKDGQYVQLAEIIESLRELRHEFILCEPGSTQSTDVDGDSGMVKKIRTLIIISIHELAELLYSVPIGLLKVIPNGIIKNFGADKAAKDDIDTRYGLKNKLVVGCSGFVRDWHRLDRVLRVIAEGPKQNWYLLVVGDGPDHTRLEAMATDLGIGAF